MHAQASLIVLAALAASGLAQAPAEITAAPGPIEGRDISDAQATAIAGGFVSLAYSIVPEIRSLALEVENQLPNDILESINADGALLVGPTPTDAAGARAYLEGVATGPLVGITQPAWLTALPTPLRQEFEAFQTSEACAVRQVVRTNLGLSNDASATNCGAPPASTGGAVAARPSGVMMLAGGMAAAAMAGAAAVLL